MSNTMCKSLKKLEVSHVEADQNANGAPQCFGSGEPEVMSSGICSSSLQVSTSTSSEEREEIRERKRQTHLTATEAPHLHSLRGKDGREDSAACGVEPSAVRSRAVIHKCAAG